MRVSCAKDRSGIEASASLDRARLGGTGASGHAGADDVHTCVSANVVLSARPALGVVTLLLVMIFLSRINERAQYPYDLPVEFSVAFVVTATALLTIAYDQRLALGISGGLSILATLASRGDFGLFVTLLSASGVVIYSLKDIRTRSKLIIVGFAAGVAAFVASGLTGLPPAQDVRYVLAHALALGAAAIAAGFFVQGVLPQFERLFGVATSMTLLEWCDASRPLLRRLAQEAPGTYSHSLILSQMAEEAANAVGANGLLARVGALYHDIGKITKAEYFVENQEAKMNRHERLSPTMSLLIIVGHVKDGIEMARAYGRSEQLRYRGPSRLAGGAFALAVHPQPLACAARHSRAIRAVRGTTREARERRCAASRRSGCAAATSRPRTRRRFSPPRSRRRSRAQDRRGQHRRRREEWNAHWIQQRRQWLHPEPARRRSDGTRTARRSWCSAPAGRHVRWSQAWRRRVRRRFALTNRTLDKAKEIADAVGPVEKVPAVGRARGRPRGRRDARECDQPRD